MLINLSKMLMSTESGGVRINADTVRTVNATSACELMYSLETGAAYIVLGGEIIIVSGAAWSSVNVDPRSVPELKRWLEANGAKRSKVAA